MRYNKFCVCVGEEKGEGWGWGVLRTGQAMQKHRTIVLHCIGLHQMLMPPARCAEVVDGSLGQAAAGPEGQASNSKELTGEDSS